MEDDFPVKVDDDYVLPDIDFQQLMCLFFEDEFIVARV